MSDCCVVPCEPHIQDAPPLPAMDRERLVRALKALAEPSRMEIFGLIAAQSEPLCVCHIVERMPLQQPTISHHLRQLREAGLVTVSRRGTWAYYAVDPRGVEAVRALVDGVLGVTKEETGVR
ncbi:MAG: metalloregulator ArsR/SmtB family transcription factor [Thermomicrobiales bacterium]